LATLRIGYIGAGSFTNHFIYPQLRRHDVKLVAVCDLVQEKAQAAARTYGFERVYTDFEAMCDREDLDAAFCVGGPKVHYEVGKRILPRGLPLYIQKSPAPSAAQTQELADLAAEHETVCHVGFNLRQAVAVRETRREMARPEFGAPTLGVFRYGLISGRTLRDAVMDQHCHLVDTARHVMGEVREIEVWPGNVAESRCYCCLVKFESGAVGTLNFTSEQIPGKEFIYFEVTGQDGHFVTCHDGDLTIRTPEEDRAFRQGHYVQQGLLEWFGYVADVANFLAAVRGDEEDRSPVADTVATMALCEEIYRQLQERGAET